MSVLLFAPRTNLAYVDEEVNAILRTSLSVTPVLGNVTHEDFLREVEKEYDVLWLCTHGSEEGILLSDGLLQTSLLVALVRDKFKLIVLNTCESIQVAQMIQNETSAEVVATIVDVPDREAFQTGAIFARELAKTGSSERAYNVARPGSNRTYVRLAGRTAPYSKQPVSIDETIVKELQMAVFGNPRVNFSGMMTELKEIRNLVNDLSKNVNLMQESGSEHTEAIANVKSDVNALKEKVISLDEQVRRTGKSAGNDIALWLFGVGLTINAIIRLVDYFF